jgi:hypothetical protein
MMIETIQGYHDTAISGIVETNNGGNWVLFAKCEDGTRKTLTLAECEVFRVVDFTLQNIVSRIMVFHGESIDEKFVTDRLSWASSLCDASSYLDEEAQRDLMLRIKNGELCLVVVEPSAGAEIVAVCRSFLDAPTAEPTN